MPLVLAEDGSLPMANDCQTTEAIPLQLMQHAVTRWREWDPYGGNREGGRHDYHRRRPEAEDLTR
jgi:hypothetical protein